MKVNLDLNNKRQNKSNSVNFQGYNTGKDNRGNVIYEFNYPYNSKAYDCYLEVCKVGRDDYNNYFIIEGLKNLKSQDGYLKLSPEGNKINMTSTFGLHERQPFAYHYVLVPKGTNRNEQNVQPIYKIDAGDYIDFTTTKKPHEIYNIVAARGPASHSAGAMKLLMPDFYNPGWIYDDKGEIISNPKYKEARYIVKNFANKIGGSLAGIEKDVRDGKFDGYAKIISTPLFTDDSLSAHAYWNKNCMQIAQSLGTINNYASLQREMFKKGINFVSDGAYVNEGLEGVHFKHVLKWREKSPYFRWFNANNLKNGPLTLGVFGKNTENFSHKIVNSKYTYTQDPKTGKISIGINRKYDKNKPTYFQIFDKRLVSEKFIKDTQYLIKEYDIPTPDNELEINTHNDTIIPYSFEISPEDYDKNIRKLIEYNNNITRRPPANIVETFDNAIDDVFPAKVDSKRNVEIHNIFYKAIDDVENSDKDKSYKQKVDLIIKRAKDYYGLKISERQEKNLAYNLKKLHGVVKIDSYIGTRFLSKFKSYELEEKIESKVDTWDANTDIPKLKYLYSNADTIYTKLNILPEDQSKEINDIIVNNYAVQDYAILSGMYWTETTNDILNLYVAQKLTGIDAKNPQKAYGIILNNIQNGNFPQKLKNEVNSLIVKNVLSDNYNLDKLPQMEYKKVLLNGLMKLPLDSIEFGDNLTAVFASPYISKYATDEKTLGKTRFDMYYLGNPHLLPEYESIYNKMDKIYEKELSSFATEIIDNLNAQLPPDVQIYSGYQASKYGKYVIPQIAPIIAKYAIIKALAPSVEVKVNKQTGEISYDYQALKDTHLQSLGIVSTSDPKDEAEQVLSKLRAGLKKLNTQDKRLLVDALFKSLKGTNENSFMLAEMITDRLNAGLDWRIDAAKDIGDMNALKGSKEQLDKAWNSVTDFWKNFTQGIYSRNRNSYVAVEITDEGTLFEKGGGSSSRKYANPQEMIKKFLRVTGMTAPANYSHYFSAILNLLGKEFESFDKQGDNGFDTNLSHRIDTKTSEFFNYMPYEGIINSYNFIGNHDKPRALHGLIMDTDWFTTDLSKPHNRNYRERAAKILNGNYDTILERRSNESDKDFNDRLNVYIAALSFNQGSGKSFAMAETLHAGFTNVINEKYGKNPDKAKHLRKVFDLAIADLAQGSYKGENFEADGFGVKPLETAITLVLKQAIYKKDINLTSNEFNDLKDAVIQKILEPALPKLRAMIEILTVMPGMPTLYAGDDLGATGYESSQKNLYLQNRSYIHNEWLDEKDENYKFIQDHYKKINNVLTMRSRPELHAMNDGAPFLLNIQKGSCGDQNVDLSAILRQGTDNSVVISLINTTGINHTFDGEYKPQKVTVESISLSSDDNNPRKFTKGLTPGTILHNAQNADDRYIVREFNGNIFIKHIGENGDEPVTVDDTTLTLYSLPPKRKTLYNPKFIIGNNTQYKLTNNNETGRRLSLISK